MLGGAQNTTGGGNSGHIKDSGDAGFLADVIEASRSQPVIVDFWAPWCGPCRQLTPALEKQVNAAKGAVKLVKIDIDKNPRVATQLRIQSIPTVYAFVDGQPVDGFQGALPESQIKAFIERLSKVGPGADGAADIEALLAMAAESAQLGDLGGAAQAYAQLLQLDPENAKAIAGLARVYLASGDLERAEEILSMAPAGAKDPELDSVRAALKLARAAPASDFAEFEDRLKADPNDHQARYALAEALAASGRLDEAVDALLHIFARDREWNGGAARAKLVEIFEAAGPNSDVAKTGRRRLSSLMFS
ncbi:MAG: thioredoxin [Proteobacteria bacterium]|nr:thioredoxin [Pseudomonadota bacterium]